METEVPHKGQFLSPILFSIAVIGLPERLGKIENLHNSIYADDVTLWISRGNDGQLGEALRATVDEIEDHLSDKGLRCWAEKSELFVLHRRRSRKNDWKPTIRVKAGGEKIHRVETIRIMGLWLQSNNRIMNRTEQK